MPHRHTRSHARTTARRAAATSAAAGRAIESLERRVLFAIVTWDGSADADWSTAANWDTNSVPTSGDTVVFPANAQNLANNQDINGLSIARIQFTGAGGGYNISGLPVTLATGVRGDNTAGTNTLGLDLTIGASTSIYQETGGTLVVDGDVGIGANTLTFSGPGTQTINGAISGTGNVIRAAASNTGSTTFTANNAYSGTTTVSAAGNLIVSDPAGGTPGTGTGNVNVQGNLRGDGEVGDTDVASTGTIYVGLPGSPPTIATLSAESLGSTAGATLRFNVNSTTAQTGYDQLVITGSTPNDTIDLGGVVLRLDVDNAFTSNANDTIVLIRNLAGNAIQGIAQVQVNAGNAAALTDGGTVTIGGRTFTADYTGGQGHDLVLTDTTGNGGGGGGGGGANQPPVNTVPTAQTVVTGQTLTFNNANNNLISVADPDAGSSPVSVTLTATGGTIDLGSETGLNISNPDGDASTAFTGTIADVNAALSGLTFTAGPAGAGSLQIVTDDQGNTGTGGAQTDTDTVNITVTATPSPTPTNQPPVNTVPAAQTVATGQVLTFNAANNNLISVADPDAGNSPVSVTLTATNGSIDLASESGLNVSNPDGDASVAFTGPIASVNAALNGLTFTPTAAGPATLQIVTDDQGNTGTGGAQTDTDTVNITVGTSGTIQFDAANVNVDEDAGVATVTVTRDNTAAAATVDWAIVTGGTATGGTDYVDAGDADTGGTVTFAAGAATATFQVAVSDDLLDEADETINLQLSGPSGGSNATLGDQDTATLTIVDDDPTPTLRVTDAAIAEGAANGNRELTFNVLLSAPSGRAVTVDYATAAGTATAGQDYTTANGTLTFAPGETSKEVTVSVVGDSVDEATAEAFTVALSNAANAAVANGGAGTGTGTIVDDDGGLALFVGDVVVTEGDSGSTNATFTVGLTAAPPQGVNVTVDYATSNGTATAGQDYTSGNGTLTFSGSTTEQTITVPVTGDGIVEPLEDFTVTLSGASNAELGVAAAQGLIVNDDEPVGVSIDDASVTEGDAGTSDATFTVTLSQPSPVALTVQYTTNDASAGAGTDYTTTSGTLSFAAGETSKTITVPVVGDTTAEDEETFTVTLSQPAEGALLTDALGVGVVADNDEAAGPQAQDDQVTRAPGTTPVTINVLANDAQFTGDDLTVTIVDQPTRGTAVVNNDNTITYTPSAAGVVAPDFITYRVSNGDDDDTAQVSIFTTGAVVGPDPANPSLTALFVAGDTGANKITIGRKGTQLRIRSGREDLGLFDAPTGSVVVIGGDGDDKISAGAYRGPVRLDGGNGVDKLSGGRFGDVLIGGAGDDTLSGGAGRDIIIGGAGADKINGAADEDIIVAGSTEFDADTPENRAALADLLTAWNGAAAYAARVTAITSDAGVGTSGASLTVGNTQDDAAIDRVNGGAGDDLFFANDQGGTALDKVAGRKATRETLVDLTNNG